MDRHKVTHVPVGARLPVSIQERWRRQTVHREWTYDGRFGEWDCWTHPLGWRAEGAHFLNHGRLRIRDENGKTLGWVDTHKDLP